MKARAARELYAIVGRPSLAGYIGIMKHNLLPNVKVTTQDVINAGAIYGKDISRNIQFTTIERLENRKASTLILCIRKRCKLYQWRGFVIEMCLMDNEFDALRRGLLFHQIALNTCAPGEHRPDIERWNSTVKERVRGLIMTVPFGKFPTLMIIHVAVFSVMWLNCFPPQGGISPTLSPQAILVGIRVDHDKHCRIPFGGYAQVHTEPTPTNDAMESRTVGGVSLGPTCNIQGSYHFISLLTGHWIKARSFTQLPMPAEVIATIESFATCDATSDPAFEDRRGRRDWETKTDDPREYHDAQEYVPVEEPNVPLRPDSPITPAELLDLTADATAHGDIPVVDGGPDDGTEMADAAVAEVNIGANSTDAGVNDGADTPGPGVQAEIPGVQADTPGVQNEAQNEILGVQDATPGAYNDIPGGQDAEHEIEFETDSEYKPNNTSTSDEFTDSDDSSEHSNDGTTDQRPQTINRSGRKVRINPDLFDNYHCIGVPIPPDAYTPSVQTAFRNDAKDDHARWQRNDEIIQFTFTQYSLK
jgi:hypothetical protein